MLVALNALTENEQGRERVSGGSDSDGGHDSSQEAVYTGRQVQCDSWLERDLSGGRRPLSNCASYRERERLMQSSITRTAARPVEEAEEQPIWW